MESYLSELQLIALFLEIFGATLAFYHLINPDINSKANRFIFLLLERYSVNNFEIGGFVDYPKSKSKRERTRDNWNNNYELIYFFSLLFGSIYALKETLHIALTIPLSIFISILFYIPLRFSLHLFFNGIFEFIHYLGGRNREFLSGIGVLFIFLGVSIEIIQIWYSEYWYLIPFVILAAVILSSLIRSSAKRKYEYYQSAEYNKNYESE